MGLDSASESAGLHTALHELMHILGGVGPSGPFIDDTGAPQRPEDVWQLGLDSGYGDKPMTYIVTPRVRAITRAAFGCDSLPGFALEDVELGRGVHWEVRVCRPISSPISFTYPSFVECRPAGPALR